MGYQRQNLPSHNTKSICIKLHVQLRKSQIVYIYNNESKTQNVLRFMKSHI